MTWLRPDLEQNERHAEDCQTDNMVRIPGGTFRMGSDHHDPEEAPAHRVTVDGFWIDCTPVTNRQFKRVVIATGHKTTAEIPPDPKDYRPHCRTCFMPARRTIVAAIALRRACRADRYVHEPRRIPLREEDTSRGIVVSPHSEEGAQNARRH